MKVALLGAGLGIPVGYMSGTPISGSSTWSGQTFASLGLTPGQYVYSTAYDTGVLNIGGVPEPATWAMMLIGFGSIGLPMRRRNNRRARPQLAWRGVER